MEADVRQPPAAIGEPPVNHIRDAATLSEREARFRALVEATSQMVWTTDPEGRVVEDSPSWRAFTGQALEQWLGYGWLDALHPEDRERAQAAWRSAVSSRSPYSVEYRLRRADGQYRLTLARGTPVPGPDGQVREWVGCNVDITDQREAERALQEQREMVETLNRLGRTLSGELDLEKLVQAVTDAATEISGAQFGAFFYNVVDAKGESYRLCTISGVPKEHFAKFPMPRNTRIFAPTFAGEGVIRLDDVTADPRYAQNPPYRGMPAGHLPVRSYLALPVVSRTGKVLGGLFFGHARPGVFTERAEKLVLGLAAQAAVAMDNAALFREAQAARHEADAERGRLREVLAQAPVAIALLRGPEHRFELVNDVYRRLIGRDPTGKPIREAFQELTDTVYFDLLDQVFRTGEPFSGKEVAAELDRTGQGKLETGYFNFIYHPLRGAHGRVEGILVVASDVTEQVVARKRVEELAAARERDGRLLASRARQLGLSASISAAVAQIDDLPLMLHRCAETINTHLDAAFTRIWTLNEAEQVLELQASAGLYTHLNGAHSRVPVGALKIGRIASERMPHLTNQVLEDERVGDKEWARREGMVAFAGYPLISGGRLVGVVALFARQALGEDVLNTLAGLADALASGIARNRAEAGLRAQSAITQAITDNAALGLVMMDVRQHCTFMNPAAEKIFGLTFAEVKVRNAPLHDVVHHTHPDGRPYPMADCPIDRALPTRKQEKGEDVFVRPDGSFYPVAFTASPLLEGGRPVGTVIEVRDITEQKQAEAERERLIQNLERSNKELDQFAYVASHDLKAPLRGIANLSAWLEEDLGPSLSGNCREQMNLLRSRVHRMEALIEGILNYSRAGRVRHKPERVEVNRLLEEVIELLSPKPGVRVEVAPDMPVLETERVPLQQVFMNLVGNALKHARKDDVHVRVWSRAEGDRWQFSVADNGQGIAPEYHARIWGIFQTLEARDKVEGTGIGLSVVQKVVESRGGRAWVESTSGAGATFHFTWPATAPKASTA